MNIPCFTTGDDRAKKYVFVSGQSRYETRELIHTQATNYFNDWSRNMINKNGRSWVRVVRAFKQLTVTVALLAVGLGTAHAIDVDAADFVPAPAGTNIGLLYLQAAQRDSLYAGGNRVPGDNRLDSKIGIARWLHFTSLADMPLGLNVLLPFGRLEGKDGASFLGTANGVGDLGLVATLWPYSNHETGLHFAIANYLFLPTGQYDRQRALSLGENRVKYIAQPNMSARLNRNWAVDIMGDVTLYGKNDDFGIGSGLARTMKQKPSLQLQGFLRYALSPTAFVHLGLSHSRIGATEVADIDQADEGRITKAQVGGAFFVAPKTQLLLTVGRDLKVSGGPGSLLFKENARLNLRLVHIF